MNATFQSGSGHGNKAGLRVCFTLFATLLGVIVARAIPAPIGPGGSVFPPPPGVNPTGILLASATMPFSSATLNGTLISEVFSNDTTSLLSGLTFAYRIVLSSSSANAASQLSVSRFDSFATQVSFFGDALTNIPPSFISRSSEGGTLGDVMQFHFGPPGATESLIPGGTSSLLIVQTDSFHWQPTTASLIDGVAVANIASLAPLSVPEPGTITLGLASLLCFTLVRRGKFAQKLR